MGKTIEKKPVTIGGVEYESVDAYVDEVERFNKFIAEAKRFKKIGWISEYTLSKILLDQIILLP